MKKDELWITAIIVVFISLLTIFALKFESAPKPVISDLSRLTRLSDSLKVVINNHYDSILKKRQSEIDSLRNLKGKELTRVIRSRIKEIPKEAGPVDSLEDTVSQYSNIDVKPLILQIDKDSMKIDTLSKHVSLLKVDSSTLDSMYILRTREVVATKDSLSHERRVKSVYKMTAVVAITAAVVEFLILVVSP